MTVVVNLHAERYDVYIGRGSKWGNPFKIAPEMTRPEAIAKYEAWIRRCPHLMRALPELAGKRLGCFCAPNICHGDVLVRLVAENVTPSA
jgi:hypothetical protein